MYHAIAALKKPHLKWLDLWSLAEKLAGEGEEVVRVVYCSATRTDDVPKMLKHRAYLKALEARGVDCRLGHFVDADADCRECGRQWVAPTEKQSDVALALAVIDDAYKKLVDKVYLLTADSDQVATISLYRKSFPDQHIISVAPPGQNHHAKLRDFANGYKSIKPADLELCLLPALAGPAAAPVKRPADYTPP